MNPPEGVSYTMVVDRLPYPRSAGYYAFSPWNVGLAAVRFFLEHAIPLKQKGFSLIHSFFWDVRKFTVPWIHESDQSFGQFLTGYNGVSGFVKRAATAGFSAYLNSRACKGVVTWSEWARRGFIEDGVDGSKVFVIPPPFDPVDDKVAHEGCNVLFLGRDYDRKGGREALAAFGAVSRSSEARLTYVGRVDDPLARKGMTSDRRITHLENPSNRTLDDAVWPVTDIFLLPTRADAFAISVVDAMRRGIPVVASRLPAISEIVQDRVSGLLSAPGDEQALVSNLEALVRDGGVRKRMGDEARIRAESLFSTERVNDALTEVYVDAL
jgi:glycosyltransferase involved in cell wall biosynthesis